MLVFDFTKCYPNLLAKNLSEAAEYVRRRHAGSTVVSLCQSSQKSQVSETVHGDVRVSFHAGEEVKIVMSLLENARRLGGIFELVSYSGQLLAVAQGFQSASLKIKTVNFKDLSAEYNGSSHYASNKSWPLEGLISKEETLSILIDGLRSAGFTSREDATPRYDILKLIQFDSRYRQKTQGQSLETGGMVKILLDLAQERNLIRLRPKENDPANPLVYLLESESAKETIPNHVEEAPGASEFLIDKYSEQVSTGSEPCDDEQNERLKHRSQQFQRSLQLARLGPFSRVRLSVFDEIASRLSSLRGVTEDQNLTTQNTIKLSDLVRDAVRKVQECYVGKPVPWRKISPFILNLLLKGGCVLDSNNQVFPTGLHGALMEVGNFNSNWRCRADAILLTHIIQAFGDIDHFDDSNIAGALYLSRDEDSRTKALELLAYLEGEEKIETISRGGFNVYRIKMMKEGAAGTQ